MLDFKPLSSSSFLRSPNVMDPKVEKLLEGKSTEFKLQAIAFSVACILTRPTGNTSPEISIFDREYFDLLTRTMVSSWVHVSISLPHNLVFILHSQMNSKEVKKKWKGPNFPSKKRVMKEDSKVCFLFSRYIVIPTSYSLQIAMNLIQMLNHIKVPMKRNILMRFLKISSWKCTIPKFAVSTIKIEDFSSVEK